MLVLLERKIILIFCYLLKEIVAAIGIVITYNESIIKTLEEEKEYNDLNYYNMKKAPDYKKRYLLDEEANMFLTVDSLILTVDALIELNNLILGKNWTELRKINVKPAGYAINFNLYFPWWCVETSLYILSDNFNERRITNREFCNHVLEIHPFLDGNGRTCKLLFINQMKEKECMSCCLIN